MKHRRQKDQDIDLIFTNKPANILRLEALLENHRAAGDARIGRNQLEPAHVVHWPRIIKNRILATKIKVPDLDLSAMHHRFVAQHASFWLPGRP